MKTKISVKFTRSDYMANKCSHREYYGQFVTEYTKELVARHIGRDRIIASKDEHFNDIPLREWDSLARGGMPRAFALKDAGDFSSLSTEVCLAKEAARRIKAEAAK